MKRMSIPWQTILIASLILDACLSFQPSPSQRASLGFERPSISLLKSKEEVRFQSRTLLPVCRHPSRLAAFETAVDAFDTFYKTQPFLSAFVTCSVKASAADLLAQATSKAEEVLMPTRGKAAAADR